MVRTRELYIELKIPERKILLEQNRPHKSSGFPYFLHKVDDESIQAITFHDYPKGLILYVKLPVQSVQADKTGEINLRILYFKNVLETADVRLIKSYAGYANSSAIDVFGYTIDGKAKLM